MGGLELREAKVETGLGIHALGSMRVTRDGVEQRLGGPRQRRLLAVLLIHRDTVVSVDRLADVVFAGEPTEKAATTLRSYVARLRRVLGDVVATRAPGYQFSSSGVLLDVADFEAGVATGRAALNRQDPVAAVEALRAALAAWHGEAYAEFVDELWALPESRRLSELRLIAQELLVESQLACGATAQVLPELEALCREHPLREAFRVQLMTAYYRAGRQADALAVYREFRAELADELGIDPSQSLVELEQRILAQDPDLLGALTAGEPLRGYRLGERLGSGRDGTVYAARLRGIDREFALKTMRPDIADDPAFIRAFEAVAHRIASLPHPAVVTLHDWWREPGAAYVVMRRLPGGTLSDRMQHSPLARREVISLVERVGGALSQAAALGLVHGRVTADDVLYDGCGEPVLTDFWLGGPDTPSLADDVSAFAALVGRALSGSELSPELAGLLASPEECSVEELTSRLLAALGALEPAPGGRNPYQGLRAFDEADAENYFGRATLIEHMLERLSGDGLVSRLVLLVGASGTGKSSAVRAGLLPGLRAGGATGSGTWFVATMLPGGAPYKELSESLRQIAVGDTENLQLELAGLEGIDRTLRRVVPEHGQLLLVIDQFEELFTLSPETEQQAFLEALTHALTAADSRLRVVATLRADYYDRPLGVQPFGTLVQDATVTITPMLPAEVEAAVVEPARGVGRTVERALAAELVGSLVNEPTALPALQFVLFELAERDANATLSLAAYRDLGGIERAIAARAEELYLSLDDTDRQQVRELFERLVVVDADGEPTRRRASREELQAEASVVDRWAASRLLTLDVHPQTRAPIVEVAHEALVREWPRLRQWIEDDRSALIVLGRLRDSAATWADLDHDPSSLLRGAALEAALAVADSRSALAPKESAYLDASREARDAEQARQDELIRRQTRTNRRLRLQLGTIAVALVVALIGGLLAIDQRQQAVRERHVAVARELAAAAAANIRDDPELSILLALAAVDATQQYDEPVLPEAGEALHQAVTSDRILQSFSGVGGNLDWSADGKLLVTEGIEETGIVDIRDAVTGRAVQKFQGDAVDLNDAVFSRNSRRVITAGDEGAIRVWDVATSRKIRDVTVPSEGSAWGPSASPDGRFVAGTWPEANTVRVIPTSGGDPWVVKVRKGPGDTAFSPDGRRLAVAAGMSGEVHVLDLATHRDVLLTSGIPGLRDLAWSPDGRWIATSGNDGAHVYDADTGRLRSVTGGNTSPVNGVAWSPDSRMVATGSEDGTARVFAVNETVPREIVRMAAKDQSSGVRSVDFSPDGTQLMTSDWSVTSVKVWDVRPEAAAEVVNLPGGDGADWGTPMTPDGRSVWVSEDRGGVSRYDLASGTRLQRLPRPSQPPEVQRLSLSPDGRLLAVADWRLPVPVWDAGTGEVAFVIGEGMSEGVSDIVWDGSGEHLAVGINSDPGPGFRSRVLILDQSGATVGQISGEPGVAIRSVSFRGDGDVVATTGTTGRDAPADRGIRLWDWRHDKLLGRIDGNTIGVVYDASGQHLLTTRLIEGVADVWNAGTGTHVTALEGHAGIISDLAFDATGERVATASTDGSVRMWDPRTGQQLLALRLALPVAPTSVSFSPDGTRLVTAWADGMTRVWTLDLDELMDIARSRLTRVLTPVECRRYLHVDMCTQS